jgi:hypothetical protein
MRIGSSLRKNFAALGAVMLVTVSLTAVAQTANVAPAVNVDLGIKSKGASTTEAQEDAARLDADADDDGIMDAVKTLPSVKSGPYNTESSAESAKKEFRAVFRQREPPKRRSAHDSCTDYMLLSPEQKRIADQKVQSRTLGMFGSRPCDPFVSDILERPFDTEYIEIPLKPVGSVIVR